MAKIQRTGVAIGFTLADAVHVYSGIEKHWSVIRTFNVSEADKRAYGGVIDDVRRHVSSAPEGTGAGLEETRSELRDVLGLFRRRAKLATRTLHSADAAMARELKLHVDFPENDKQMKAHVDGLPRVVKKYAARLSASRFGKDEQARLADLVTLYLDLLRNRGAARGEAKAARTRRDALLAKVRNMTRFFRDIGREALYDSPARADFDRVKRDARQQKKATAGDPPPAADKPAAAAS